MYLLFTKKNCSPLDFFENSGLKIKPESFKTSVVSSTGTSFSFDLDPKILTILCLMLEIGKLNNCKSLLSNSK